VGHFKSSDVEKDAIQGETLLHPMNEGDYPLLKRRVEPKQDQNFVAGLSCGGSSKIWSNLFAQ
jgi:hypothetical protein